MRRRSEQSVAGAQAVLTQLSLASYLTAAHSCPMDERPPTEPSWFDTTVTESIVETPRPSRWRTWAVAGTGSLALAGVVAGITLANGAGADAASATGGAQAATTTTVPGGSQQDRSAERQQRLEQALQPLVDDGTLTTEQRDAVVKRLLEAAPADGMGRRGHGHGGPGRGMGGPKLDAAASALGVTVDDLRAALRDGKSIADVATERGVAVDTVIDALVKEAQDRMAQRERPEGVTPPTEAQLRERITAMGNGTMPERGPRGDHDHSDDGDGPGGMPGAGMPGGSGDTTTTTVN